MKIVNKQEEFENLFLTAKQEAKKFFGNDEVYIEKFFQNPRHIEVQVLSGKNRTVHLHERDCSVQRRHQKLIEETPSPVLDDTIRKDLFEKTTPPSPLRVVHKLMDCGVKQTTCRLINKKREITKVETLWAPLV